MAVFDDDGKILPGVFLATFRRRGQRLNPSQHLQQCRSKAAVYESPFILLPLKQLTAVSQETAIL